MARRGKPGVITVGDRRLYPRSEWGHADWEAEDRLEIKLSGKQQEMLMGLPPPGPQISSGFRLFPKPEGREAASARSRGVDRLLKKLGVR